MSDVHRGWDQTFTSREMNSPSPQSTSGGFPNETWNTIFRSLDHIDLAQVARVSRRWNAIAERLLYTCISISETVSSHSQVPQKTNNCCDGLLRRPYLAELVRSFQVRWIVNLNFVTALIDCESGLRDLSNTLRILTSLESLDLSLNLTGHSTYHSWDLLNRCHFPFLRRFALSGMGYTPVSLFLNNTPSILHLALVDYHQTLTLDPCALPSLCSFRGSPATATLVVPGRPVDYIELVGQGMAQHGWLGIPRDAMSQLALTSIPVRYLDLSGITVTPTLLGDISNHLHSLEILKVRFALRHTLHFAHSGITILEGLTHILRAFHRLSELDFSSTSVGTIGPNNAAIERSLCKSWAAVCPSLTRVVFPSKNEWLMDDTICQFAMSQIRRQAMS